MRTAWRIARAEWVHFTRSRVAVAGLATLLLLTTIAVALTQQRISEEQHLRSRLQAETDQQFDHQPNRHPHRMVHYGTYAHRPVNGLAAFEPGLDPWTGTLIYLEGHRQNSATFSHARENSGLIRFGELTPAFVLNTLVPLLLVFLGFSTISREREQGQLRLLRLHGARPIDVIAGKTLALSGIAAMALLPAWIGLALVAANNPDEGQAALMTGLLQLAYLLIWVLLIVAASALLARSRSVLITGLIGWVMIVVLVPRLAGAVAMHTHPLPSKAETDLAIQQDLRQLGDSHNPDDPYFNSFREKLLAEHGVQRVEDLPFNYRGRLMEEGEALTSRLFTQYAQASATRQQQQLDLLEAAGWISPSSALRLATMNLAATDLRNHLDFLAQAEAHRYRFIQALNRLHAEELDAAADARRSVDAEAERATRIDAHHWAELPDFHFVAAPLDARIAASLRASVALLLWLVLAIAVWVHAVRRLDDLKA